MARANPSRWRRTLASAAALAIFIALSEPSRWAYLYALRETYRTAEFVGIMDQSGGLGGQVLGYNFLREPQWAQWLIIGFAGAVGFGPALTLSFVAARRIAGSTRATICGACGADITRAGGAIADPEGHRCPVCKSLF